MTTIQSLQARIEKLQAQAEAMRQKQSSGVISKIHSLMNEHGLTIADLDLSGSGKTAGRKLPAKSATQKSGSPTVKYRDPKSGATWSGHGRAPGWIVNAKSRDKFLIDGSATSVSTAAKKSSGAVGNYVRGPQPTKYRDPKSGAEWSGRGRAPAWLANVKDRSKYLIDVATADAAETKTTAAKKARSKKVAGKVAASEKTATKKPAVKRAAAKKSSGRGAAKKVAAKGTSAPAKKASAKKAASKRATARKAAADADSTTNTVTQSVGTNDMQPSASTA